jgi:hypothetical protein
MTDETQAMGSPPDGPNGPTGPPPGPTAGDDAARRKTRAIIAIMSVVIIGLIVGIVLATRSDNKKSAIVTTTTTTKAKKKTSDSSTTTTTAGGTTTSAATGTTSGGGSNTNPPAPTHPPAPTNPAFTSASGSATACTPPPEQVSSTIVPVQPTVHLAWTTTNATSVTISINGVGIYNTYGPNQSTDVPFSCDGATHTYTLAAKSPGKPDATKTFSFVGKPR